MKKLVVSPAQAENQAIGDQQVDVDRALAGDRAAEQHHGLAGDDEADEGAGLGEGEDADQQVGPGAERVGDFFEQVVEVEVAELLAEQVVAEDHRRGDDRQDQPFAVAPCPPPAASRRHPRLADDRVVAVEPGGGLAGGGEVVEEAEGGRARAGEQGERRAGLAQGVERVADLGRSERAAGSRSLASRSG